LAEITEAPHISYRHIRGDGRVGVRRKKYPVLGGMLVVVQPDLKSLLDVGRAADDIEDHAIGIRTGNDETVILREFYHRLIIVFGRAKAGGEFGRGKEPVEIGAMRVVEFRQQAIQFSLVTQRKSDGEGNLIGSRHFSHTR